MHKKNIITSATSFLFFKDIRPKSVRKAIEKVMHIAELPSNKKREVEMVICSVGGNCEAALAFYDVASLLNLSLTIIGTGEIESSAVMLFLTAEYEKRFLTPNAVLFFHEVALTHGKEVTMSHKEFKTLDSDLQEGIVQTQESMIRIMAERTGLKPKKILKLMKEKTYLNAEDAVKYRFASKIVPNR